MRSTILRPRVAALIAAAAIAAAAFAATSSSATPGHDHGKSPGKSHGAGSVVHVIEHAITDTEQPGVGGADVAGNILTFTNPVYNTANTTQVGHDEGFCTRLDVKAGIWECLWTTFLKAGQITVQGPYYDSHNSVLSITGGTGAYRKSRGEMTLISRDGGKEYDFIFHLN